LSWLFGRYQYFRTVSCGYREVCCFCVIMSCILCLYFNMINIIFKLLGDLDTKNLIQHVILTI
jgi:hypothetical protein